MVLLQLVKREVKAFLKNPAFVISLVMIIVVYGMIGGVMRVGVEEATRTIRESGIGLVVEGTGEDLKLAQALIALLNRTEVTGVNLKLYSSVEEAVESTGVCAIIPRGFAENITSSSPIVLFKGAVYVDSLALFKVQAKIEALKTLAQLVETALPIAISIIYGEPPPREVKVVVGADALLYGKRVDANALLALLSTVTFLPMVIAIVMGSNAGYAAQLVAFEKVEKAFEMLLSQPIRRSYIVLAKIIGASIATMLFALVYVASLIVLFTGMMPSVGPSAGELSGAIQYRELSLQLGIDLGYTMLATLALSVVIGLLSSGSLGIVLGALSPDERTAGVLITPIMLLYIGIGFVSIFLGIELSAFYAALSGITMVAMPAIHTLSIIAGKPLYVAISIVSAIATCLALVALAVIIFNREIIVLGIRLRVRREE